ncbi:ExeA family protein [Propionivibrio dicarboxylicus]|uniref:Type II secretory pathway, component ExeA (Predicted ATPase) n=1 Tax=Propionivibrio dicarboxylicus TaxID=83767 RepID=A0A1G8AHN1_9RHOO|nr:AAA family ATPase [Propionivibrio dicarboxylicus]SDH20363.1 Type II secretory pathway, component ExeA (predicted ATPase) [Propionivibrio dicarboxylicus]
MVGGNCIVQPRGAAVGAIYDESGRHDGAYLDHFGLRASPFRSRSEAEAFFCGTKRSATLDALVYALSRDEGVVKVSGEPGSGKSTLFRRLAGRLSDVVRTISLSDPGLSCDDVLRALAAGLALTVPAAGGAELLEAVQARLDDIRKRGDRIVVLVDDAEAMPVESLALLCRLSDDADDCQHRLHVAVFGAAALDACLAQCRARVPRLRVTYNFVLDHLSRDEVGDYLDYCLDDVGYDGPPLFSAAALETICRASDRQFARINRLADQALQCAACGQADRVERKTVEAAMQLMSLTPVACRRFACSTRVFSGLAAVISLCLVVALGLRSAPSLALPPPSLPVAVSAEQPVGSRQAPIDGRVAEASVAPDHRLDEAIARAGAWLREVPDSHFVIQLLRVGADERDRVERFLDGAADQLDLAQLRIYRSRLSGQDRLGVIYGDFPDRRAAQAALGRVLSTLPDGGFYVRPVSRLR